MRMRSMNLLCPLLCIFPVKYVANRITVINEGIRRIENRKIDETELNSVQVPTIEQYKMTKNAHSEEYLVAYAVRKEDSDERINKLLARYPKLTTDWFVHENI